MGETANIAQMAEQLSDRIFKQFFWEKMGPININWACQNTEKHGVEQHPTDVVFMYEEPYTKNRRYFQCDLKSYSKSSITKGAVAAAALSLAKQVACAEISDEWQNHYLVKDKGSEISGLLFVYNHDREFDRDFKGHLTGVDAASWGLSKQSKIYIVGPDDINWFDRVCSTLKLLRGEERLPHREHWSFHHPDLIRKANVQQSAARAATIEMLTSSSIVMKYDGPLVDKDGERRSGLVIFLRRETTVDSMKYVVDYLRNFQFFERGPMTIDIMVNEDAGQALEKLQKASKEYLASAGANSSSPLAEKLNGISVGRVSEITTSFSEIEIGMSYER